MLEMEIRQETEIIRHENVNNRRFETMLRKRHAASDIWNCLLI